MAISLFLLFCNMYSLLKFSSHSRRARADMDTCQHHFSCLLSHNSQAGKGFFEALCNRIAMRVQSALQSFCKHFERAGNHLYESFTNALKEYCNRSAIALQSFCDSYAINATGWQSLNNSNVIAFHHIAIALKVLCGRSLCNLFAITFQS